MFTWSLPYQVSDYVPNLEFLKWCMNFNLDIIAYESETLRLAKFCIGKHIKSEDLDSFLSSADY